MGDVGTPQEQWLVSPTAEIETLWKKSQIQEKKSRINRFKQDIDDIMNGRVLELQAKIKMLELELNELECKPVDVN